MLCLSHIPNVVSLRMQVPNSWKSVWDTLLEHLHLLHRCGRSFNDLVAVFIPSLIPTESLREKARLQLLCVLQPVDDQSSFSEEASEGRTLQLLVQTKVHF